MLLINKRRRSKQQKQKQQHKKTRYSTRVHFFFFFGHIERWTDWHQHTAIKTCTYSNQISYVIGDSHNDDQWYHVYHKRKCIIFWKRESFDPLWPLSLYGTRTTISIKRWRFFNRKKRNEFIINGWIYPRIVNIVKNKQTEMYCSEANIFCLFFFEHPNDFFIFRFHHDQPPKRNQRISSDSKKIPSKKNIISFLKLDHDIYEQAKMMSHIYLLLFIGNIEKIVFFFYFIWKHKLFFVIFKWFSDWCLLLLHQNKLITKLTR